MANSTQCNCTLPYAYVIPEGNVRSHLYYSCSDFHKYCGEVATAASRNPTRVNYQENTYDCWDLLVRITSFGLMQEANTLIGDEVGKVVELIAIVVFDSLSVVIDTVVVESTVAYQTLPLRPAGRYVLTRVLVQILAEVTYTRPDETHSRPDGQRSFVT